VREAELVVNWEELESVVMYDEKRELVQRRWKETAPAKTRGMVV